MDVPPEAPQPISPRPLHAPISPRPLYTQGMIHLFRDDPLRPPSWRWQQAVLLADGYFLPLGAEPLDPLTLRATAFLRGHRRCATVAARDELFASDPDLRAAHEMHLMPRARLTWEVEARLLAGEEDEAIAGRLGLSPGTVATYAQLFFDVRDRLKYTVLLQELAVGSLEPSGEWEVDLPAVARAVGLGLGVKGLDDLLDKVNSALALEPQGKPLRPEAPRAA